MPRTQIGMLLSAAVTLLPHHLHLLLLRSACRLRVSMALVRRRGRAYPRAAAAQWDFPSFFCTGVAATEPRSLLELLAPINLVPRFGGPFFHGDAFFTEANRLRDTITTRSSEEELRPCRPMDVSAVLSKCLRAKYKPLRNLKTNQGKGAIAQSECSICLDKFEPNQELLTTPCNHAFHSACLTPWIQSNHDRCPVCRVNILGNKATGPKGHTTPARERPPSTAAAADATTWRADASRRRTAAGAGVAAGYISTLRNRHSTMPTNNQALHHSNPLWMSVPEEDELVAGAVAEMDAAFHMLLSLRAPMY